MLFVRPPLKCISKDTNHKNFQSLYLQTIIKTLLHNNFTHLMVGVPLFCENCLCCWYTHPSNAYLKTQIKEILNSHTSNQYQDNFQSLLYPFRGWAYHTFVKIAYVVGTPTLQMHILRLKT